MVSQSSPKALFRVRIAAGLPRSVWDRNVDGNGIQISKVELDCKGERANT